MRRGHPRRWWRPWRRRVRTPPLRLSPRSPTCWIRRIRLRIGADSSSMKSRSGAPSSSTRTRPPGTCRGSTTVSTRRGVRRRCTIVIEAFGLKGFRPWVARLPPDPVAAIAACLEVLERPSDEWPDFLHRQLVTVAGWAGYVQYRVREDALRGRRSQMLTDLLAIRLAYDAALVRTFDADLGFKARWRRTQAPVVDARRLAALERWHSPQAATRGSRPGAGGAPAPRGSKLRVAVSASMSGRSAAAHLERLLPETQTVGFADSSAFPWRTIPRTPRPARPVPGPAGRDLRTAFRGRGPRPRCRGGAGAWKAFQGSAASGFSFVESVGLSCGFALGRAMAAGRRYARGRAGLRRGVARGARRLGRRAGT